MTPWRRHDLTRTEWVALSLRVRVELCMALYVGWRYGTPRVAFASNGIPANLLSITPSLTDCSTMTASIVLACYPDVAWMPDDWADLEVYDRGRPWSPVECAVSAEVGDEAAAPTARGVYLVQAWKRLPGHPSGPSGHAFLLVNDGDEQGFLTRLHATSRDRRGPTRERIQWAALVARYPAGIRLAKLRER